MFRAPLCPSSGAREYYASGCCLSYLVLGFQVVGMVWSWGLCVRFAGCNKICNKNHLLHLVGILFPHIFYILWWKSMHWFELLLWNWLFLKIIFQQLTGCVEQSPFWIANSSSRSQENSCMYGTWKSITTFTNLATYFAADQFHSIHWRSILILPAYLCLGLPSGLFPSGFPTKTL